MHTEGVMTPAQAADLQHASARAIARGVLMARDDIGADEALEMLVRPFRGTCSELCTCARRPVEETASDNAGDGPP